MSAYARLEGGPVVVIVGGGLMQIEAVAAAHRLGYAAVVTDRNPDCVCADLAEHFEAIDINDSVAHRHLVARLQAAGIDVRGIFCEGIDAEETCAEVSLSFGFNWMKPSAALACHNKLVMRWWFSESGLAELKRPEWRHVRPERAVAQIQLARFHLPFVVKPLTLSASRGVTVVREWDELDAAIAACLAADPDNGEFLVEEFLEGPQQSVELLLMGRGTLPLRLNIVDRTFSTDTLEVGHINPSQLPVAQQDALYRLAETAAKALGVTVGAFKCDTIWTADGPAILEVAGRLSGGFDSQITSPLASGRDIIGAALLVACRDERIYSQGLIVDLLMPKWERVAVCYGVTSRHAFTVPKEARPAGIWRDKDGARVFRCGPGDEIRPATHCAERIGFAIACAPTYFDADLDAAMRAVEIENYYLQWAEGDPPTRVVEDER